MSVGNARGWQGVFFAKAFAPFAVVEAVTHGVTVGAGDGQVHLGDDAGKDAFDQDGVGDDGFDAFRTGLIEEGDAGARALLRLHFTGGHEGPRLTRDLAQMTLYSLVRRQS